MSTTEDPIQLGEILEALKAHSKLGAHLEHAQIFERWDEMAGPVLAKRSQPMKLRRGVLTVAAVSPVWMHRFSYEKASILKKINKLLTRELIEEIFLTLPADAGVEMPENGS
jgi:predicted nucleic acid-binding Zn ribbon protein